MAKRMNVNFFIDIETIPGQTPEVLAQIKQDAEADKLKCKAPANYKDPEKIAANIAEQHAAIDADIADKWHKTSLDGAWGQVVCIGAALDDKTPWVLHTDTWNDPGTEAILLTQFNEMISNLIPVNMNLATVVIGHNVSSFDLRFLMHRYIVNKVRPHPILSRAAQAKPWEQDKVYDTMTQWAGVGKYIKLDKLCKVFGMAGKGDIDGSEVWEYVQAGRIQEVANYCADDVSKTRDVYKRMTFQ